MWKASAEFVNSSTYPLLSEWILKFVFTLRNWFCGQSFLLSPEKSIVPVSSLKGRFHGFKDSKSFSVCHSHWSKCFAQPTPCPFEMIWGLHGFISSGHSTNSLLLAPVSEAKGTGCLEHILTNPMKKAECWGPKDISPTKPGRWLQSYERSTDNGVMGSSSLPGVYKSKLLGPFDSVCKMAPPQGYKRIRGATPSLLGYGTKEKNH